MNFSLETITYRRLLGDVAPPLFPPLSPVQGSRLCKQADCSSDTFRYWCDQLKRPPTLARKLWELVFIAQSLFERGLLSLGRRGLAFGVGREPLPALFASLGCTIVATDQDSDGARRAGWQQTDQHAAGLDSLEFPRICDPNIFRERVTFEAADMNDIPQKFRGGFDFCWSACSLEHLGSLEHGLAFVETAMKTLKEGGVAIHTTEFNLSSNSDTFESRDLSLYRRRDIQALVERLTRAGHDVEPIDFDPGDALLDGYVDLPPYREEPHLRLRIGDYDCTSIGIIISRRPPSNRGILISLGNAIQHNSARIKLEKEGLIGSTRDPIWNYAVSFDLRQTLRKLALDAEEELAVTCEITLMSGALGLGLSDDAGVRFVAREVLLEASAHPQVVVLSSRRKEGAARLIIRNTHEGESQFCISSLHVALRQETSASGA